MQCSLVLLGSKDSVRCGDKLFPLIHLWRSVSIGTVIRLALPTPVGRVEEEIFLSQLDQNHACLILRCPIGIKNKL